MFSRADLGYLNELTYDIIRLNNHDVTIHSRITDHEWIVVSNYETPECYILHRHSRRYPFHRQQGRYKDLKEALDYIENHDEWFFKIRCKTVLPRWSLHDRGREEWLGKAQERSRVDPA